MSWRKSVKNLNIIAPNPTLDRGWCNKIESNHKGGCPYRPDYFTVFSYPWIVCVGFFQLESQLFIPAECVKRRSTYVYTRCVNITTAATFCTSGINRHLSKVCIAAHSTRFWGGVTLTSRAPNISYLDMCLSQWISLQSVGTWEEGWG